MESDELGGRLLGWAGPGARCTENAGVGRTRLVQVRQLLPPIHEVKTLIAGLSALHSLHVIVKHRHKLMITVILMMMMMMMMKEVALRKKKCFI